MIFPAWWAEVWVESLHGYDGVTDVLRVDHADGVARLLEVLRACRGPFSVDVYDADGVMRFGESQTGAHGTVRPVDGLPVRMDCPRVEGRWCWEQERTWRRVDEPPSPELVQLISHRTLRGQDVAHLAPYDLDPNPVSLAMKLRKQVWQEAFERKAGTGAASPK